MQNILEFIQQNPNVVAESRDDASCRTFLATMGLIDEIDAFTKAAEPSFSVMVSDDHLTHWIVAMCWSGHRAGDNGYQVFCLPKIQTTEQQVRDFVDFIHKKYQGRGQRELVS